MSSSAFEEVRTTTGMERSSGSSFISLSTVRPSLRGMFKSSRMSPGLGASAGGAYLPCRRRYSSSSSPFSTKRRSLTSRASSSASLVRTRSSASSSAIKMVMGLASLIMGGLCRLFHGQCDNERRSLSLAALCHNRSAVPIGNFAAHGEADPSAFVLVPGVQPLEDIENLVGELLIEAYSVVLNRNAAEFTAARSP